MSSPLSLLRSALQQADVDGFLVPMADEYQSEYVPASARRLEYLTGFTGSAGFAIVLKDKAAFFTDSRYTLQAKQQIAANLFALFDSAEAKPSDWLAENVMAGQKIGFDPWLHPFESIEKLTKALAKSGATLTPLASNPVDQIWANRPAPSVASIVAYDVMFAGKPSDEKRADIAADLRKAQQSAAILTDPASVAWLLNVRGDDVPHTPLPLSYALIRDDASVAWFVDTRKITPSLRLLLDAAIHIESMENFTAALDSLERQTIRVDAADAAFAIVDRLKKAGAQVAFADDPCALPKACKNLIELTGMRAAHRRDGAAIVKFLAWLSAHRLSGTLTELDVEQKLASFRAEGEFYRGPSFDTIAGVGGHGAIVHYRATEATNSPLKEGNLFLLDSGGQYLDGTTDVTRTLALGEPTAEQRDRFTRVLKGHIALAAIRFPAGTTGAELDVLARQYLWEVGLDYGHGTGHGVGSYLGVHEGPQSISKRSKVALQAGMILSNEPGFYKESEYGIRIENLQAVTPMSRAGEASYLGFETLTLVPIDSSLIEGKLLSPAERHWLNAYHAHVREMLRPLLDAVTLAWLEQATEPLAK